MPEFGDQPIQARDLGDIHRVASLVDDLLLLQRVVLLLLLLQQVVLLCSQHIVLLILQSLLNIEPILYESILTLAHGCDGHLDVALT